MAETTRQRSKAEARTRRSADSPTTAQLALIVRAVAGRAIRVERVRQPGDVAGAHEYYDDGSERVVIDPLLSPQDAMRTAVHEACHARLLHHKRFPGVGHNEEAEREVEQLMAAIAAQLSK